MHYIRGKFLTTAELAARWGVSEGTLRNKRADKKGPPFVKLGSHVLYEIETIKKWEVKHGYRKETE